MKRSRLVPAACLSLLAAAGCESDPTTACAYRLSEQIVSLPVGESLTVANQSACLDGARTPVSWTARRPQIVRVTPSQDLSQAQFDALAAGVDTVDVRFEGNRNLVVVVGVGQ